MLYHIDWSALIGLAALIFSIATFIVHDKKIKRQEQLLNAYQLEKFEEEKQNRKSAKIRANLIRDSKGSHLLKIFNAGQSKAEDVKFFLDPDNQSVVVMNEEVFPWAFLNPQESIDVRIITYEGSSDKLTIVLKWRDDFRPDNEHRQIIGI